MPNQNLLGARIVMRDGTPIDELKGLDGRSLLSTSTGEINASDNRDALQQVNHLMSVSKNHGGVVQQRTAAEISEDRSLVTEAFNSNSSTEWAALGSSLAQRVELYAERSNFMRSLMMSHNLRQGEHCRIPLKQTDVMAVVANGMDNMGFQRITNKSIDVPEFEVKTNVRVSRLDLEQQSADLLDEAYQQSLEAIAIKEDRLWKEAADKTVGNSNPLTYLGAKLTPATLARLAENVSGWNIPTQKAMIANDFWVDIQGSADWATALDPITQYELILTGRIATMQGMEIMTDAFRSVTQKVMEKGEIYVVSSPEYHGIYTNRGGITSTPTDGANSGNTDKGWLLSGLYSLTIANTRSLAKGIRG